MERAALSLPAATLSVQWGCERVYKVGGRIFAVTDADGSRVSLKVSEIAYEVLIESGRARPAQRQIAAPEHRERAAHHDEPRRVDPLRVSGRARERPERDIEHVGRRVGDEE